MHCQRMQSKAKANSNIAVKAEKMPYFNTVGHCQSCSAGDNSSVKHKPESLSKKIIMQSS